MNEHSYTAHEAAREFALIGLDVRTRNVLVNANLFTLEEVCEKSEAELLRLPNLGRRSILKLKSIAGEHGFTIVRSNETGWTQDERLASLHHRIGAHYVIIADAKEKIAQIEAEKDLTTPT